MVSAFGGFGVWLTFGEEISAKYLKEFRLKISQAF
jgi:hypothetical protein